MEEDGFRLVQRRKARNKGGGKEDRDVEQVEDDDGMDLDDAADPADDDDGGIDGEEVEEPEEAPDPSELRQLWQKEVGVVKQLAKQGLSLDHPAMVAAIAARDGAEDKWRGAKVPAPLATRLGWAQKKLDRSIEIQAGTRQEMSALEREYKSRMAELQSRMDEDSARVKKRRQQLEAVQKEAGGGSPAPRTQGSDGEAVRRACDTLRQEVAPALVALAEKLGTGTEAWETVNGLLAKLSSSQQVMDKAAAATAQTFDLADGDESHWSESHDLQDGTGGFGDHTNVGGAAAATAAAAACGVDPQQAQRSWQPPPPQQQHAQQWAGHSDAGHGGDGGGGQAWEYWQPSDWTSTPMWRERGHGQWTRASWADAWENENGDDEDMEEQTEPQSKHRRQGGASYDVGEKQPSAGGDTPAPAAQAGQDPPLGQTSDAARQLSETLSHVVAAAISAGVQPLTAAGEELHVLDFHQLAAWAAEHLPPN